jgi:hypothetical protein
MSDICISINVTFVVMVPVIHLLAFLYFRKEKYLLYVNTSLVICL